MELVENQPLLEWLANNYKSFGATLEIITDKSQEGSQFVRGFGGIGGQFIFIILSILYTKKKNKKFNKKLTKEFLLTNFNHLILLLPWLNN